MTKNTIHTTLAAAALAGLILTTGCAAPQAPQNTQIATTTTTPTTPSSAGPAVSSGTATPAPETPQAPALETFTFPDGHVSFTHPAGWTVNTRPGPALDAEAQKTSFHATVHDASGAEVASVFSGMYGDGAAGPARRTVLDHAPVPGISPAAGEATEFGFAYDEYPGTADPAHYFMDVRRAGEFLAPDGSSGSNQVMLPNGVLTASVVFGGPVSKAAFETPAAAEAWMGSEQYRQLKAMLLSLTYQ
ncbi:hypothetical protein [Arthrobacter sp. EPSL27]|uniref:hypothetical protein n=1 Tax=Arthrobacter sp. EPSL27 TaxID=1745378 RepID=UPI00074A95E1|nr:hypothetical protein [Arthrobacter sp. EPSL27]KUM33061.1 hypothetical protein AR539_13835 [Arthrobacter sp. EPSL27]